MAEPNAAFVARLRDLLASIEATSVVARPAQVAADMDGV